MRDTPKKHLSNIRTFAKDLNAVRANRNTHIAEISNSPAPIRPIKLSAKKDFKEAVSEEIPKPKVPVPIPKITVPSPAPEKEPPVHTTIPAFHELKKHHSSTLIESDGRINIVSRHASKTSEIKSSEPRKIPMRPVKVVQPIKRFTGGSEATIITDTKESSFKLVPSVFDSIKSWFKELNKRRKKKKTPTYTIPETNRRKGVIQIATSKTGTIFTADNDTIKEQIRRRRLQEEHKAETSWSPFTETGYNLLEAPHKPTNVKVEFKKQARFENNATIPKQAPVILTPSIDITPTVPVVAEIVTTQPEVSLQKADEVVTSIPKTEKDTRWKEESVESISILEDDKSPEIESGPAEFVGEESEEVMPEPEAKQGALEVLYEEPIPEIKIIPEPNYVDESSSSNFLQRLRKENTNTQTIVILMILVGIVAMIFIVKFIFQHLSTETNVVVPEIIKIELVDGASQIDLTINPDTEASLSKQILEAAKTTRAEIVEITITVSTGDEMDSSDVFELMQFDTEPSLNQSIKSTHFVSVNQSEPALILNFTDESTVRGGLLKWEAQMSDNLSELFSLQDDIDNTKFKDIPITGFDVRVLKTENGTQIVYGIVNHNTVIITTSESKFSQIVKLAFPN